LSFQLAACAEMLWRNKRIEWRASRLKRGGAEDVSRIVRSLVGGDFVFATGSVVHADGGLSLSRLEFHTADIYSLPTDQEL